MATQLVLPSRDYFEHALRALRGSGWRIDAVPDNSRIPANKWLVLTLKTPTEKTRFRLLIYAVATSSRGNPDERRVEITTTYLSDLPEDPTVRDVVLGWERQQHLFIGLDPERLRAGGDEHNASSFVDYASLTQAAASSRLLVTPRPQRVVAGRDIEYQGYFQPRRLTEYLFNQRAVHDGRYRPGGPWDGLQYRSFTGQLSGPDGRFAGDRHVVMSRAAVPTPRTQVDDARVERLEKTGKPGRTVTPEEFARILQRQAENGEIGERFVFDRERRHLRTLGLNHLADAVKWIARENVAAGYDIDSFFDDGSPKRIEVKSAQANEPTFEMSRNEWATAQRLGMQFVIARVTNVREDNRSVAEYRDPLALAAAGTLIVSTGTRRVRPA